MQPSATVYVRALAPLFAVLFAAASLGAQTAPEAARVRELAGWLPAAPAGLGEPITNRAAWREAAPTPGIQAAVKNAPQLLSKGLPACPDELYLDFSRTGNRDRWQNVAFERRSRIGSLTLAECVANDGRYLAALEETFAAICAEKTWVMPAHDRSLANFKGETVEMDLGACMVAWDLATARWLLGDKLSPATRRLIAENLERRIFAPYRAMIEGKRPRAFWLDATHNWNAVCLAGVTGSALATVEDREARALFAAAAEHYVRNFLRGFPADGYCSEGLGYWNYGFGHFQMLTETLREATGGQLDLLALPAAQSPALFGHRVEILNGVYPSIADCSPGTRPDAATMHYLAARFGLPEQTAPAEGGSKNLYPVALASFLPQPLPRVAGVELPKDLAWRTWFPDGGVLICRPGPDHPPFAVCLKGGHNAEHHNHNDVGSFSVISGRAAVIADTGAEVYTARTFSGKRYESDALNSFGHAVPVVAGQWQRTGAEARARVLRAEFTPAQDSLALDIRSAYAVPALTKLERSFTFHRGAAPSLKVTDDFAFSSPQAFETALVTWGDCQQTSANELTLTDGKDRVRVRIETGGAAIAVRTERLKADYHRRNQPLRVGIALTEPASQGVVALTITPVQ
jgi:hypothetical protein